MYNYLNTKYVGNIKKKNKSFDYFYWKYIYGDIIISKFINFLVKSGYKNRAIKFFFKALSNLKSKFGINPILLVKYIILKRNVLHKVTKKKVKQKTFFYLRLLDFEKQISSTIRKIMVLVLHLKEKKQLKLWQSIFLILLNFCILKNKKKVDHSFVVNNNFFFCISKLLGYFSILRFFDNLKIKFFSFYNLIKSNIYLLNCLFEFIIYIKNICLVNLHSITCLDNIFILKLISYSKLLRYYISHFRRLLLNLQITFSNKLFNYKSKIEFIFITFLKLKRKYVLNKMYKFKKFMFLKKQLLKNKVLFRNKYKQHFLTRFFFKELNDLKKASKFKNSFLNFKLRNKKKKELSLGTRIHAKHDIRLRHRKIFFRVSKYGQIK